MKNSTQLLWFLLQNLDISKILEIEDCSPKIIALPKPHHWIKVLAKLIPQAEVVGPELLWEIELANVAQLGQF